MKRAEIIERVNELIHERQNIRREHDDLQQREDLLFQQLKEIADELPRLED